MSFDESVAGIGRFNTYLEQRPGDSRRARFQNPTTPPARTRADELDSDSLGLGRSIQANRPVLEALRRLRSQEPAQIGAASFNCSIAKSYGRPSQRVMAARHSGWPVLKVQVVYSLENPTSIVAPPRGGERDTWRAEYQHFPRVLLARMQARTAPRWNVYAAESLRGALRRSQHLCRQAKHKNVPYHPHVTQSRLMTKPNLSMHLVRLSEHEPCSINMVSHHTHTLLGDVSISMLA
jgi:hypothetical protein